MCDVSVIHRLHDCDRLAQLTHFSIWKFICEFELLKFIPLIVTRNLLVRSWAA